MAEKQNDLSPVREPSVDEGQMAAEKQMRDIGADLYLEVRQYSREELEAERKIVLRKIDWVIMPMVYTPCLNRNANHLANHQPADMRNLHNSIPR
jgi:hypothetical protein